MSGRGAVSSGIAMQVLNNAYASTNVTTGAYVELDSALNHDTNFAEIVDTSGALLKLAIGPAGSESDYINIPPGGNGLIPLHLDKGARLSIKSIDTATVNTGRLSITLYR